MKPVLISTLMVLIPVIAYFAARFAQSRVACWLLRIGGLVFALTVALSVIASNLCVGDLMTGFAACSGPGFVVQAFNMFAPLILMGIVAYLSLGPVLLVVALIFEALARRNRPA
ncbi:hypothetical protein [Pseudooceanicola algae]|uniref:Uncharacterized protein n=1 Tax=Pseudooceanicola algae TaxID=1537215 RepID=A0A418SCL1_9RHOB|nr:hypothetical protein [Pseudooceanicola algae]QPM90040.1 hypothetical protein PSAL_012720 [Pseudooceanicola algae]